MDFETKALNENNFKDRLKEDLAKLNSVETEGAIALIRVDEFLEEESFFDNDPFPKVLKVVSESILEELTLLNIFGRIDERTFAVHFFNTPPKQVYIWAEKLRVKIARTPIAVVAKQNTYTISVGVATSTSKTYVDEVLHNADLALKKAVEKGGNAVRNIS